MNFVSKTSRLTGCINFRSKNIFGYIVIFNHDEYEQKVYNITYNFTNKTVTIIATIPLSGMFQIGKVLSKL